MNTSQFKITGHKGFHITFPNGYTISVQFGAGNYCDNYHSNWQSTEPATSSDAEIAFWSASGEMENFDLIDTEASGDTVNGHCDSAEVLKYMNLIAALPAKS